MAITVETQYDIKGCKSQYCWCMYIVYPQDTPMSSMILRRFYHVVNQVTQLVPSDPHLVT